LEADNVPLILMADDDDDDCTLARDAFSESGTRGRIHFVDDGIELLDYLSGSAALPTVILLDLNMPRKNGRQALNEIKSTPAFQNIPVVVLTTSREEDDFFYCREKGVNLFLTKPSRFSEWVEIMNSLADTWLVTKST
jgi:CheY-like chemotaxis protein